MNWKYHIEAGDLVRFTHMGDAREGTVNGLLFPYPPEEIDNIHDVALNDVRVIVTSGSDELELPMEKITDRVPEDERKGDGAYMLGERFRLNG